MPCPDMPLSIVVHHSQGGLLAGLLNLVHAPLVQIMLVQIAAYRSRYVPPYLHTCFTVLHN